MEKGICKHYKGIQFCTDWTVQCKLGIDVLSVTPDPDNPFGRLSRIPCVREGRYTDKANQGTCSSYAEPSEEELKADEAKWDKVWEDFKKAQPLVREMKQRFKGIDATDERPCPVCGGNLFMRHHENGHVHGLCETAGCLKWME